MTESKNEDDKNKDLDLEAVAREIKDVFIKHNLPNGDIVSMLETLKFEAVLSGVYGIDMAYLQHSSRMGAQMLNKIQREVEKRGGLG